MERGKLIGLLLLLVGVGLVANSQGYLELSTGTLAAAQTGNAGVKLSSNLEKQTFLSTVSKGGTYKWKVKFSNTGDINWNNAWYNLRIEQEGTNAQVVSLTSEESEKTELFHGTLKVFNCNHGQDVAGCRAPYSNWNLKYKTEEGGYWREPSPSGDDLASFDNVHALDPGQSQTIYFKLTVPSDISEDTKLVGNLECRIGDLYVLDNDVDTISPGNPEAKSTMKFMGGIGALAIGALAFFGKQFGLSLGL